MVSMNTIWTLNELSKTNSDSEVDNASVGALWDYWNTKQSKVRNFPIGRNQAGGDYNRQGRNFDQRIAYGILGLAALGTLVMLSSFFISKTKST